MTTDFENVEFAVGDDGGSVHSEAAHVTALIVDELDDDRAAEGVYTADEAEEQAAELMTETAFLALWRDVWSAPGMVISGLKDLAVTEEKKPYCDLAGQSAFWLLNKHFPGFLKSENETFAHIAAMTPFLLMQGTVFAAYFQERRQAKRQTVDAKPGTFTSSRTSEEPPSAANDQTPPASKAPDAMGWMDQEQVA